ncbi:MAG: TrbG/VirB9 family P-type conjugative transfer protein, partial [Alphaproteobacteria bacterium]
MSNIKFIFGVSLICMVVAGAIPAMADYNFSWEDANANMAAGSVKPGYAQLSWSQGAVLPIKLRDGMVTMISLPNGEQIADAVVGDQSLFSIETTQGDRTMFVTPTGGNEGISTNMIVMGQSGNKYIFYLTAVPINSSEVAYSQVDVILDGNSVIAGSSATPTTTGTM